ncbi:MAG: hypothetical protein NVSMB64_06210 [Candidatus Velthaea sp.]
MGRSKNNKLSEIRSIMDPEPFSRTPGGLADGVTDCSPILQAQLNRLTSGGSIYIPPTKLGFLLKSEVQIPNSNITIYGDGRASKLIYGIGAFSPTAMINASFSVQTRALVAGHGTTTITAVNGTPGAAIGGLFTTFAIDGVPNPSSVSLQGISVNSTTGMSVGTVISVSGGGGASELITITSIVGAVVFGYWTKLRNANAVITQGPHTLTPGSMTDIVAGGFITLDAHIQETVDANNILLTPGTIQQETVQVLTVTATTFTCIVTLPHAGGIVASAIRTNIHIKNLAMIGGDGGIVSYEKGIHFSNLARSSVEDCYFTGFNPGNVSVPLAPQGSSWAIFVNDNVSYCTVNHNVIEMPLGVNIAEGQYHVGIWVGSLLNGGQNGFHGDAVGAAQGVAFGPTCFHNAVTNNVMSGGFYGIDTALTSHTVVNDNRFIDQAARGLVLTYGTAHALVSGNSFLRQSSTGIALAYFSHHVNIVGNKFAFPATGQASNINASAGCYKIGIVGNQFLAQGGLFNVALSYSIQDVLIAGNQMEGAARAIEIQARQPGAVAKFGTCTTDGTFTVTRTGGTTPFTAPMVGNAIYIDIAHNSSIPRSGWTIASVTDADHLVVTGAAPSAQVGGAFSVAFQVVVIAAATIATVKIENNHIDMRQGGGFAGVAVWGRIGASDQPSTPVSNLTIKNNTIYGAGSGDSGIYIKKDPDNPANLSNFEVRYNDIWFATEQILSDYAIPGLEFRSSLFPIVSASAFAIGAICWNNMISAIGDVVAWACTIASTSGTCSVAGTTVTRLTGPSFVAGMANAGYELIVAGAGYFITGFTDGNHITLGAAPPATANAPWTWSGQWTPFAYVGPAPGAGTVTSVSGAGGVAVATPTTTPAISLSGAVSGPASMDVTTNYKVSGTNVLAARYGTAAPVAATDLASVITLANWLRAMAVYHGLGA